MPALAYNNIVLPVDDPTLAKDEQQQMMQVGKKYYMVYKKTGIWAMFSCFFDLKIFF